MLASKIDKQRNQLSEALYIGRARWDKLISAIAAVERDGSEEFYDEQVWTFIASCAYAAEGQTGAKRMAQCLSDGFVDSDRIWFEVLPLPPRVGEGNTNLDLAFGDIRLRQGTKSGIELANTNDSTICFCECKWYSDISSKVSYDQHRNQLARVAENALLFSDSAGEMARHVHVTLVTPSIFKQPRPWSRLYQYKWDDYKNLNNLLQDLSASRLPLKTTSPSADSRISNLTLHWVPYETLLDQAPDTDLKGEVREFFRRYSGKILRGE